MGHLLVAVAIGCTLCGAVELEDGVEADFPDSLRDRCRLGADSDLALVFVAAQFALDGNVRTLGESGGELSQPAEGGAEGKAEASQARGAARTPKQCRDKGGNRKRTGNSFDIVGRLRPS